MCLATDFARVSGFVRLATNPATSYSQARLDGTDDDRERNAAVRRCRCQLAARSDGSDRNRAEDDRHLPTTNARTSALGARRAVSEHSDLGARRRIRRPGRARPPRRTPHRLSLSLREPTRARGLPRRRALRPGDPGLRLLLRRRAAVARRAAAPGRRDSTCATTTAWRAITCCPRDPQSHAARTASTISPARCCP